MVRYMIRNRAYLGERIYNRRSYKVYRRGERAQLANAADAWIVKKGAHDAIIDSDLFERVQNRIKTRVVSIGRPFHRPYLLTGLARCAQCGYRMIGQPSTGNGHRYLMYTCSGYLRIGKAVCRSVHILAETLEAEVVRSIRSHLTSPTWKEDVRTALKAMVGQEFGDDAQTRAEEIERQLAGLNRQIANIIDAIKVSAHFSEAIRQALADLETQRDSIRASLREAEGRANRQVGADALAEKTMEVLRRLRPCLARRPEGRRAEGVATLLRPSGQRSSLPHGREGRDLVYKIPIPTTQMTPALSGLEPLITRVSCGGRHLPQVKAPSAEVLPFTTRTTIALKRPYDTIGAAQPEGCIRWRPGSSSV